MTKPVNISRRTFAQKFRIRENRQIRENRDRGFTLVELSLAMTFLAFIILFVVTMIMQMINIYNKSISLSQMNQSGRQIMSDLNNGARFGSGAITSKPDSNRLCVGGVSYIWNTASDLTPTGDPTPQIHAKNWFNEDSANSDNLHLVRIKDGTAAYCKDLTKMPPKTDTGLTVIVGKNVLIQRFAVDTGDKDKLLRVNVTLSTAGNNAPTGTADNPTTDSPAGSLKCETNNFCAFANYNFIIYRRGAK